MVDPVSIVSLVGASTGLVFQCASAVKTINDVATKYKTSKYTVLSMTQNLDTMQIAWNRIGAWIKSYIPDENADDDEFLLRMARILEAGGLVVDALGEELAPFSNDELGFGQRAGLIWNEKLFLGHQSRLNDQAISMNLLLQAVQLPTSKDRESLIRKSEKQFKKSDESAYSIVPSRLSNLTRQIDGGESLRSGKVVYRRLSFENELFTSRVYKRNYRNNIGLDLVRQKSRQSLTTSAMLTDKSQPDEADYSQDNIKFIPSNSITDGQHLAKEPSISAESSRGGQDVRKRRGKGVIHSGISSSSRSSYGETILASVNEPASRNLGSHNSVIEHTLSQDTENRTPMLSEYVIGSYYPKHTTKPRKDFNESSFFGRLEHPKYAGPDIALLKDEERYHLLIKACKQGSHDMVEKLLGSSERPLRKWAPCSKGSPLHVATKYGYLEIVDTLSENGANIEAETIVNGFRPLHLAAENGDGPMLRLLISKRAQVWAKASKGQQAIHLATKAGSLEAIHALIDAGASLHCVDHKLRRPLHSAVYYKDQPDIIDFLVKAGAGIHSHSIYGQPIDIACDKDFMDSVCMLLKLGTETKTVWSKLNQWRYLKDVVEILLKQGVDLNSPHANSAALHAILDNRNVELEEAERSLELLIEFGADGDKKDSRGNTPLQKLTHHAHRRGSNGQLRLASILAKNQSAGITPNNSGLTPLFFALKGGQRRFSLFLIEECNARLLVNKNGYSISIIDEQEGLSPRFMLGCTI